MSKTENKLTFDEALQRINDERRVYAHEVLASALRRKVWVAEWHIPGCLSESRGYYLTKEDAIQGGLDFADSDFDPLPKGMKTALRRDHFFQHHTEMFGNVNTTIERFELQDLLDR